MINAAKRSVAKPSSAAGSRVKKTPKNEQVARIGTGKPGPGRPPGSKNRATLEIKEAAAEHGPAALDTVVKLLSGAKVPATVRLAAANSILDRAYGRPTQYVEAEISQETVIDKEALDELYQQAMREADEQRQVMRKRRADLEAEDHDERFGASAAEKGGQ